MVNQQFAVTVLTSDRRYRDNKPRNSFHGIPVVVVASDQRGCVFEKLRDGLGPPRSFRQQVIAGEYRSLIDDADLLELHWPSIVGVLPELRRNTSKPLVYVTHDLRSEALLSLSIAGPPGRHNVVAGAKLLRAAPQEYRAIRSADLVLCFRDSERNLLRRWYRVNAELMEPTFHSARPVGMQSADRVSMYRLGFIADMTRIENRVSLSWFLKVIWPAVTRALGSRVELHIFGRHGDDGYALSHTCAAIIWHGWVEDISACYAEIAVAIAPLRIRGGIKFKVAEALAHGVPIITSSIAAQGYPPLIRRVLHIADDASSWISALRDLDPAREANTAMSGLALSAVISVAFDFERMAATHLRRYHYLISGGSND